MGPEADLAIRDVYSLFKRRYGDLCVTHLLAYILLLQKAWAQFLASTRGDSQLPVPPAPGDLISSSGLGGHPHNTYKQIHIHSV